MKLKTISLALVLTVLMSSCYVQKIAAPYSKDKVTIELAKETDFLPYKNSVTTWYLFYGLVPLSENRVKKVIAENGLKKVRITTKMTPLDAIITTAGTMITFGLVTVWASRTVIIEGSTE